jgi:hypothetical protein
MNPTPGRVPVTDSSLPLHAPSRGLQALLARNEEFLARFETNPLFELVRSSLFDREEIKSRFLDCFQVWSDKYQKMVLARAVFCDDRRFLKLTYQHLAEEFGHNSDLATMRNGRPAVWDPILEGASTWFIAKLMTLSEQEKIVLVHTVVEASATTFYKYVRPALQAKKDPHFAHHDVVDHDHQNMGLDQLQDLSAADYARLGEIQAEGWAMLETVMSRVAELTREVVTRN